VRVNGGLKKMKELLMIVMIWLLAVLFVTYSQPTKVTDISLGQDVPAVGATSTPTIDPAIADTANCSIPQARYFRWTKNADGTYNLRADHIPANYAVNRLGNVYWQLYAPEGCGVEDKTLANVSAVSAYEIESWVKAVVNDTERSNNLKSVNVEPAPAWE